MADREKIKTGMMELMAMSIDNIALTIDNPEEFSRAVREYGEHREVASRFLDGEYINLCDRRKEQLTERYSEKHSGVMPR